MKNISLIVTLLALLPLGHSHAGTTDVSHFDSHGVFAQFVSSSPDGCLIIYAVVFANADIKRQSPGPAVDSELLSLSVTVYDQCRNILYVLVEGFITAEEGIDLRIDSD